MIRCHVIATRTRAQQISFRFVSASIEEFGLCLAEAQAVGMLDVHARLIRNLEQSRKLDRELELLPSEEALAERKRDHRGLTRPELATLLAYSKIDLYTELLDSDVPEDAFWGRVPHPLIPVIAATQQVIAAINSASPH